MTAARVLVALYPPLVRDRWGNDMLAHVTRAGSGCWVNTVTGAVDLWLHPGTWPADSAGQVRRIASTLTFALAVTAALVIRGFGTSQLAPTGHHPVQTAWLLLIATGVALAMPLPLLRPAALARLLTVTARTLTLPVIAMLTLFAVAHSGWVEHPAGPVRAVLVVGYWATLTLGGVRVCNVIANLRGDIAHAPSMRRLQVGLALIGCVLAVGAWSTLESMIASRTFNASSSLVCIAFVVLAALAAQNARDLHDRPTA